MNVVIFNFVFLESNFKAFFNYHNQITINFSKNQFAQKGMLINSQNHNNLTKNQKNKITSIINASSPMEWHDGNFTGM